MVGTTCTIWMLRNDRKLENIVYVYWEIYVYFCCFQVSVPDFCDLLGKLYLVSSTHLRLEQKVCVLQTFSYTFSWQKIVVSWWSFTESLSNGQKVSIGWDDGLVLNRQHSNTRTNDDLVHWYIYMLLGLHGLLSQREKMYEQCTDVTKKYNHTYQCSFRQPPSFHHIFDYHTRVLSWEFTSASLPKESAEQFTLCCGLLPLDIVQFYPYA